MSSVAFDKEDWASVSENNPNTVLGQTTYGMVGHSTHKDYDEDVYRFWLKYNLSQINPGSTINSASLNMYALYSDNDYELTYDHDLAGCGGNLVDSETITWNNAPEGSLGSSVSKTISSFPNNTEYVFSGLGSIIQSALSSGYVNLRLKMHSEDGPGFVLYSLQSSYAYLSIDYTLPSFTMQGISSITGLGTLAHNSL
jgi:hypothetical protein